MRENATYLLPDILLTAVHPADGQAYYNGGVWHEHRLRQP